jgi:hypothetical protein
MLYKAQGEKNGSQIQKGTIKSKLLNFVLSALYYFINFNANPHYHRIMQVELMILAFASFSNTALCKIEDRLYVVFAEGHGAVGVRGGVRDSKGRVVLLRMKRKNSSGLTKSSY